MPIFQGSRYAGLAFTAIRDAVGTVRKFLHSRTPKNEDDLSPGVKIIEHERGEELDKYAWENGEPERHWWLIADVNDVFFAFDIETGKELAIPQAELFREIG